MVWMSWMISRLFTTEYPVIFFAHIHRHVFVQPGAASVGQARNSPARPLTEPFARASNSPVRELQQRRPVHNRTKWLSVLRTDQSTPCALLLQDHGRSGGPAATVSEAQRRAVVEDLAVGVTRTSRHTSQSATGHRHRRLVATHAVHIQQEVVNVAHRTCDRVKQSPAPPNGVGRRIGM